MLSTLEDAQAGSSLSGAESTPPEKRSAHGARQAAESPQLSSGTATPPTLLRPLRPFNKPIFLASDKDEAPALSRRGLVTAVTPMGGPHLKVVIDALICSRMVSAVAAQPS